MMKIITSACAILLLFSCNTRTTGQYRPNNDVGKQGLNGHVKYIKETEFNIDETTGQKGGVMSSFETKFDAKGNCTESTSFYARENTTRKYVYNYNKAGKVWQEITHTEGDSSITTYDFKNEKYTRSVKRKDGKIILSHHLLCDKRGNIVRDSEFNANGSFAGMGITHFDDNDNVIADSSYNHETLTHVRHAQYDRYHNMLKENSYNATRPAYRFEQINKYDVAGNQVEHINSCNNRIMFKCTFTYEHFDVAKNWLLKHESQDGTPSTVTERVIEYW